MNYVTNTEELTSIADAIREKGGTSAPLEYPEEYVSAIEAISGGGGGYSADEIAMRTISGIVSGNASFIGSYVFAYCSSLAVASFPVCINIYFNAFYNCHSLTTASFPACERIFTSAFYSCYSLTTASFPVCTSIGSGAFYNCNSLTTASFPACTSIGVSAFARCSSLTTASFPACTSIGDYAFARCYLLESAYFLTSSVPTLGQNAFSSTPIGGYSASLGRYGSVFVRESLYSALITATNWSSIASRIVSMTDAEIEALG